MILRSTLVADPSETPADATRAESGEQLVRARGGAHAPALPGRYEDLGAVAQGSFGEVRRVRDTWLDRVLAMKLLHPEHAARASIRQRFFTEVQITAQLQHPGIVPVYDHGELADGRLWYAMKEVRGRTLGDILDELFAASSREGFGVTSSGWTFRRVVEAFARIAQTMAHAHEAGVVHRDLKPENVMIGELGEVMVMDWGLARRLDPRSVNGVDGAMDSDEAGAETFAEARFTRHGDVLGTPAYMPPEQARGERHLHGPASDVYALGAMLYHVLTGRPPYEGSGVEVLAKILADEPRSIADAAHEGPKVPDDLVRAAERAMRREMSERGTAAGLAEEALAWLDGARRREEALAVLEHARALEPRMAALRAQKARDEDEARRLSADLRPFDSIEKKRPAWELEDESERLGHEALLAETEWLQGVHAALRIDPELPEAHRALAQHYRAELRQAEAERRPGDAARFEVLLRAHDRGEHAAFLRGEGTLTLVTDPPGAEVSLYRYQRSDRQQIAVFERELGRTPLEGVPLPRGSHLLRLRAKGHDEVRYPVLIERDAHWDGIAPGESAPRPIVLPTEGEIGPDECYVPAGWCVMGGDPEAPDSLSRQRIWVEGFVIGRHPVTNGDYLRFLDDLARRGREAEAQMACPCREMGFVQSGERHPMFARDAQGLFKLPSPDEDPSWGPDVPVVQIDWLAAMAYAAWLAEARGKPFRLPNELEREKAARGVDGRRFAWGDQGDATFACVLEGHRDTPAREAISGHPSDESPYGVRGLTGNVRDWCINVWKSDGPRLVGGRLDIDAAALDDADFRAIRGGFWGAPLGNARSASRYGSRPSVCRYSVGVRVVRSFPGR